VAVLFSNCIIQINELRNNAIFAQGKTVANAWALVGKTNIVIGQIAGNLNVFPACANLMSDTDVAEMFMPNQGAFSPTSGAIPEAL